MNQPIVIQQSNRTQGNILREIVDSTFRGSVHLFHSINECREFLDHQRVTFVYIELDPGSDDVKQWIREIRDDVIGLINREWAQEDLRSYIDAGLSDYVFKPYQPERIRQQVNRRVEAFQHRSAD